ncbi:MAG: hypothetical protein NZL83_03645 [Candidatus Absconditabacterales bacterium]|nr:hypothetical protein [Candidatus Absconditabacterales bacterium]
MSIIESLYTVLYGCPLANHTTGYDASLLQSSYFPSSYHVVDDLHAILGCWLQSLLENRYDDHHRRGVRLACGSRLFFALYRGCIKKDSIYRQLLFFIIHHYEQFSSLFVPIFESKPRVIRLPFSFVRRHDDQGFYLIGEKTTGLLTISSLDQSCFLGRIERDEFYTPRHEGVVA